MTLFLSQTQTGPQGSLQPHILPHELKTLSKDDLVELCFRLSKVVDSAQDREDARSRRARDLLHGVEGLTARDEGYIIAAMEILEGDTLT